MCLGDSWAFGCAFLLFLPLGNGMCDTLAIDANSLRNVAAAARGGSQRVPQEHPRRQLQRSGPGVCDTWGSVHARLV